MHLPSENGHSAVEFASRDCRVGQVRLCVIDVDGTLLTSGHSVTAETKAAIAEAHARGLQVLLATSRGPGALKSVLDDLDALSAEVFVSSQGALTARYTPAGDFEVFAQRPMPLGKALQITHAAIDRAISVNWYTGSSWYVSRVDRTVEQEAQVVGCAPTVRDLLAETAGPDKLMLISPTDDSHDLRALADRMPVGLRAQVSNPTYLEITRADVDKAVAVEEYCRAAGIDASEVLAIGDGPNDLGMFAFAGTSVAPANARPEVLAAADFVTASNDENGVAQVLNALSR